MPDTVSRAAQVAEDLTIYTAVAGAYPTWSAFAEALDAYAREQAETGPEATCPGAVASIARAMALQNALYDLGERSARSGISRTFGDFAQGNGPYQLTIRAGDLLITCHDGGAYGPLPDSSWDRPVYDVARRFLAWTRANPRD
ncbi:hypothetical protein [Streptomyces sp. MI02-7b]|uniref:hypothetical protein n=1 Tax=Streptomyces sp. MI02-7b TaxID=462941 RepID=UPI0029AD834C|nr:hypothetical protein [Streptomyces sp. MI02-7b]MDX3077851.1 hypothetical protein [Streptomyces sp. MI02-7b]